ncbi:hypothetical protein NPIL_235011 [Nephila pilipes]|uniref:Uncharacterized protein n=1 Tax=Nephila pilipes TaxID=299642 RepID=A0A8X6JQL1_NEPPI|nr:hypothetical protein NPIL_235011 [Nephila pilipes]
MNVDRAIGFADKFQLKILGLVVFFIFPVEWPSRVSELLPFVSPVERRIISHLIAPRKKNTKLRHVDLPVRSHLAINSIDEASQACLTAFLLTKLRNVACPNLH